MNHPSDRETPLNFGIRIPTKARFYNWGAFLFGGLLVLIFASLSSWPTPVTADDILQIRANTPLPTPGETIQIRLTFSPEHDGLTEIELLAARAREEKTNGRLMIQLQEPGGEVVAFREISSDSLNHNQPIRLTFPPEIDSSSQSYDLLLSGSENNNVTFWGYDLDLLEATEMRVAGAETNARELRVITRYTLTNRAGAFQLFHMMRENVGLIILASAIMFLPGCLFWVVLRPRIKLVDPAAWLGLALASGVSTWPILWLWMPLIGARFRRWSLLLFLVIGWAAVLLISSIPSIKKYLIKYKRGSNKDEKSHIHAHSSHHPIPYRRNAFRVSWHHLALFLILLLALSARMLAVRDLVFPPWVDSSRHALITTIMAEYGQWLQSYKPYLEVDRFPYHAGFHSIAASLSLLSKSDLPRTLLILGQLINAYVTLTTYAGVYLATGRKNVGLSAAFLVALPFFFPGYYVTWGRMTQITAVLTLPLLLGLTWRLVIGAKRWQKSWWLLAALIGGLFLIHFRVLLLYIVFLAVVLIAYRGRRFIWLVLAAITALIITLPQIFGLIRSLQPGAITSSIPGYNEFPVGYLEVGYERLFLLIGLGAFLLALVDVFRRKRWATSDLVLTAWVATSAMLLSGERLGLPETTLINTNSAYIVLFLPLSWILAITIGQIWAWFRHRRSLYQIAFLMVMGGLLAITSIYGFRQQVAILNPQTILAEEADRAALTWAKENINEGSKFAVNSWRWLGNTWAGSDGGAWLVPLAGSATTTPPADYIYSPQLTKEVISFNEYATGVEDWTQNSIATWLREQDITHVYIGPNGGFLNPSELMRNPDLELLYKNNGAFIFAVH